MMVAVLVPQLLSGFTPGTPESKLPKAERPVARTKSEAFRLAREKTAQLPSVLLVRTFDAGNVGSAGAWPHMCTHTPAVCSTHLLISAMCVRARHSTSNAQLWAM